MSMHTGAFGESPGTLSLNPKPGTPKNEPGPLHFPEPLANHANNWPTAEAFGCLFGFPR